MADFDFDKAIQSVKVPAKTGTFDMNAALGITPAGGFWASAKQMAGQTIKGAGQLAADVAPESMGDNALLRTGQEIIDANPTRVSSLKDIAANPLTAVTEAAGNAAPSMAGILGLRALGQGVTALAPFTGIAAPVVAGVGQAISWGGPVVAAALPSYSGIRDAQTEGGAKGTTTDKLVAGAGSLASGAIEMVGGPQTRLVKALTTGLERKAGETITKAVGKEAFKSALEEAGEEIVQNPIEQLASYQDPTTAKNIQDTLFGGAMGFLGGGVLGGGMQAIAGRAGVADPGQGDKDTATTEDVQGQSLSSIVGAPTVVSNGQAYISAPDGELIVAPVEQLTEHFSTGGKLETFDTAAATQGQLEKLDRFSLEYLTDLRNSEQALIQTGVNRKDIDAMILNKVQDTPGRKEYISELLASGKPDPIAVKEIGSGQIDSPNAPLQAEWTRQEELARATNQRNLQRINEEEQRVEAERVRVAEEDKLIEYWRSIGAVETVEEGRRLAALKSPIAPTPPPSGQPTPPAGGLSPSTPVNPPEGGVSDQQLRGSAATTPAITVPGDPTSFVRDQQLRGSAATTPAITVPGDPTSFVRDQQLRGSAATTPAVTVPGDPTSFVRDQQLRGGAATTPAVTVQPAPLRLPKRKPVDLNALLASSNSGRTVARGLADISKDKPIAAIAKRVAVTLGKDVKVVVVNPGDSIPARAASALSNSAKGVYRSGDRTVYLRSDKFTDFNGVNDNTVLHELLHAATFDRLRAGNKASQKGTDLANATTALYKLQNTIADHFNAEIRSGEFYTKYSEDVQGVIRNAAFDVDEMISYGLSNAEFQNVLKTIPYKNTSETMFSRFTKLIRRLLGLSAKDQSALTSLIDMTDTLLSLPEPAVAVINGQRVLRDAVEKGQAVDRILMEQAGRSLFAAQSDAADKVRALASGAKVEYGPRWLSVMPLHTMVQTVGQKIKQVGKVENILNAAEHVSESMITEAMQYYTDAQNSKQVDRINLVAGLSSFYRVTPWESVDAAIDWVADGPGSRGDKLAAAEKRWKASGMDKATRKSFIAAHAEARNAYKALDEKSQEAYRAIVEHMQAIRQREKNNLRTFIEQASVGNEQLKQQLLQRFNATFNDVRGAYWPLSRVGDFRMEYTDPDGSRVVKHYESDAARRSDMQSLMEDGVAQDSFLLSYKDKRPRGEVAIPMELMQQLSAAVYNQKISEASPEDPGALANAQAEAQDIVDEMNQIWLRWQPETSSLKNSLQRRNIKGFDEDMLRAYLEYTRKHASSIAWAEQGRKLEETLKGLNEEIVNERKQGIDVTFKGMVLNDLRSRLQAMREAKVGPVASFLGKLGTMYYMTSPSIALVQMTQLPILTLPKLAVKYGLTKAMGALSKGVQYSFSSKFTKDKLFSDDKVNALHDMLRMPVTAEMIEKGDTRVGDKQIGDFLYTKEDIESRYKQLSPYQKQVFILREALARNLLDISAAHEAYSLTQGKNPNSIVNRAFKLAMEPMRLSELASRKAAILSTMELSASKGNGFFKTIKDVGEVVNDTLYSYSKANKPAFLQGGTARVLAMFQWYRIMTALRIGLMFKRSIAAETPEIKSAARKEFIGIMGMTAMLAGAVGLPLVKTVFSALDALADDDEPRDSELEFRQWAAERFGPEFGKIFTHGLPAAGGMNLSKRIGLDNLYGAQSEPPPRLHGRELALWHAGNQLGPAFGVFQSWFQGYDLMSKGEYMKGLETALPKPLKDGLKALRVGTEGELTSMSGKRVIGGENLSADAVLLMALGINPTEVEEAQTASYSASKLSVRIQERRGRLTSDAVQAIIGEGDREAAMLAIKEFNKKMPRFAIRGQDVRAALRRYRKDEMGLKSKREQMIATQYEIPSY